MGDTKFNTIFKVSDVQIQKLYSAILFPFNGELEPIVTIVKSIEQPNDGLFLANNNCVIDIPTINDDIVNKRGNNLLLNSGHDKICYHHCAG